MLSLCALCERVNVAKLSAKDWNLRICSSCRTVGRKSILPTLQSVGRNLRSPQLAGFAHIEVGVSSRRNIRCRWFELLELHHSHLCIPGFHIQWQDSLVLETAAVFLPVKLVCLQMKCP